MNYKWTVLFLVHASEKHTRDHVKVLINMLKHTKDNEEIKVLVLYGALQHSFAAGVRIQVTLHELIKDQSTGKLDFSEIQAGYGVFDLGDDKKLKGVFSEIKKLYLSERFLLFTWDHGSGFGIFKTDPRERKIFGRDIFLDFEMAIMKEGNRDVIPSDSIQFEIVNNDKHDDETGNIRSVDQSNLTQRGKSKTSMLTNDELGMILRNASTNNKIDLLIMMNCAMQMIETGFAFHNTVEYLVAPETCIFWAGYNYKAIINMLCDNPDVETETLGRYAIDTIEPYYMNTPSKDYFNDLVVSLVKPQQSIEVKMIMDGIAARLNKKLAGDYKKIRSLRLNCQDVTSKYVTPPYHFIDLLQGMATLGQITAEIDIRKLKTAINNYVVHIIKGNNYKGVNNYNNIDEVNGCSIYYPPTSKAAADDFYYDWFYKVNKHQTLFAMECTWKDFLLNYFEHDRNHSETKPV